MAPYLKTLNRYFSVYLGHPISQVAPGEVKLIPCARRERPEVGWGRAVAIWVHFTQNKVLISVRPDLYSKLQALLRKGIEPRELANTEWRHRLGALLEPEREGRLVHVLYCRPERLRVHRTLGCRRLEEGDVEAFVHFKLSLYPGCDPETLRGYIRDNIREGIAFGVFVAGELVSASEAPPVGHMGELIVEVGVDTHPDFRRRGFGKAVVSAMTEAVLKQGRIPVYRCSEDNFASLRLAQSVGYELYAHIVQFYA